ncbi:hypothetical protein RI129_008375 [Pyrocoelia pectoralis]|uniref:Peptidase M3A/M3B catalytic domain-containing protein n=1 Tax=Pyrocoelia pectoralis TaxID=417401 RepID=A0AAN7V8J2_9COLE
MASTLFRNKMLLKQLSPFNLLKRHGYIVLVPEIGEDLPEKNPLVQQNGLPEFNSLTIENCMAAIGKYAFDLEMGVQNIEEIVRCNLVKDVFENVLNPLENAGSPLDATWGLSKTLYLGNSTIMPTKSYLAIHDRARKSRATKFNNTLIYETVQSDNNSNRTGEQIRLLQKFKLEGKLNGLDLKDGNRARFNDLLSQLHVEKGKFKAAIEMATKAFSHRINEASVVKDFPTDLLRAMASDPSNHLKAPWNATLQPNVYLPFMENCSLRDLRWNIWLAMVGRGATFGNQNSCTSRHLEEIRYLRREQAKLLGYDSFADMSMETKMASGVDDVRNLLETLLEAARPAQETELTSLHEFALQYGFKDSKIELWDVPYWRRRQQNELFHYRENDYVHYFPLPTVLDGLFALCKNLFNIDIQQRKDVSTWAKDVKFYDIYEHDSTEPIGGFYLDPYIRSVQKMHIPYHNGWMVGIQSRSKITNMKPLAALVLNFPPPQGDKPSLLTFKDVTLLFHKFGQTLQHLLTQATYSDVAGLSNIEWDVVEVSGYTLAHFLYNKSTIDMISGHCDNGDKLPVEMFDALTSFRKHTAGLDLCRELYLSALDLELHSNKEFWVDVVKSLWPRFRCFPLHKFDSHPCSFTQIFVEEWGAAYYSHVWARMIAADLYSAFHEASDNDQLVDVGKRFRDTFLALGGSCHPSEVFRQFRGRDPSPKALLSSLGLNKKKNT